LVVAEMEVKVVLAQQEPMDWEVEEEVLVMEQEVLAEVVL
jgi:hypothetical protein